MIEPVAEPEGGLAEAAAASELLPAPRRLRLLGYAGMIMLLASFASPTGGLIGIPVAFFLKNKLHLRAHEMAVFNLWASAPLYLGFAFGLLRDRVSPFGAGDRSHLLIFGLLSGAIYGVIAFIEPTYGLMLAGLLLVTASTLVVLSAANGLFSAIGQRHLMPGQASAVLNIASNIPLLAGFFLGGMFSDVLEGGSAGGAARMLFLAGAGLMVATALAGTLGPRSLFTAHAERRQMSLIGDIRRLVGCRDIYVPVLLLLLWNFAPSLGAALQYHLADQLHASDTQVGAFYAIFWGSYVPTFLLYGWLCQRVRLKRLLVWTTLAAIPQMAPLLLAHTPTAALIAAVPMGLMGGAVSAAYIDLAIRSCPKGLQGTMMMLVSSTAYYRALRFGDLWGTALYERKGGFEAAVIATTFVYALMLPVALCAPRRLTATTDGERVAEG
jgi:hypothetical protein